MTFQKGNPGRPKGSKNKVTAAVALQVMANRKTPLEMMLDIAGYYHSQWLAAKDGPDHRFAAELALRASTLAAPYCHARKVIIEEEIVPTINVVDVRETGRLITNGHGSNGHGGNGSNGSNGHGGNGHGGNGSNGHGPNGNGSSEAFN